MNFREKLGLDEFVITAEITPPKGTDVSGILNEARKIRDFVDAINITDNQRAVMRMNPAAVCSLLNRNGYETIMHLTCRDRNRLALQSELLGAWALGVKNILVMSGDHTIKGDHAGAKAVYDLDSVQLLDMIEKLNLGFDLAGNGLDGRTDFCTGAVTNIELNEFALAKLRKKIKMGARFIQTQAVFDIDVFSGFMDRINDICTKEVRVLAGIIPLRSEKNARFLNENIPGIRVPEDIIDRMKNARDPEDEGIRIAAGLIKELRRMCSGVHIMPVGSHENTGSILKRAGLI